MYCLVPGRHLHVPASRKVYCTHPRRRGALSPTSADPCLPVLPLRSGMGPLLGCIAASWWDRVAELPPRAAGRTQCALRGPLMGDKCSVMKQSMSAGARSREAVTYPLSRLRGKILIAVFPFDLVFVSKVSGLRQVLLLLVVPALCTFS